jgi:hypothetical protein
MAQYRVTFLAGVGGTVSAPAPAYYNVGETASAIAWPNNGYQIWSWSCNSSGLTIPYAPVNYREARYTVIDTGPYEVTVSAIFRYNMGTLTVTASGGGKAYSVGSKEYILQGDYRPVYAVPNAGSVFSYWSCPEITGLEAFKSSTNILFGYTQNISVTGHFVLSNTQYTVSVTSPAGCTLTCSPVKSSYLVNEDIYFIINLKTDSLDKAVTAWVGLDFYAVHSYSNSILTIKTKVYKNLNVTATVKNRSSADKRWLTINCNANCLATIANISGQNISAQIDWGYQYFTIYPRFVARGTQKANFVSVTGDITGMSITGTPGSSTPVSIGWQVDQDRTLQANFVDPTLTGSEIYTITVIFKDEDDNELGLEYIALGGESSYIAVQSIISYSPSLDKYNAGQVVTLSIVKTTYSFGTTTFRDFSHWSGDLSGSDLVKSLEMTSNKTITAHYITRVSLSILYKKTGQTFNQAVLPELYGYVEKNPSKNSYLVGDQVTFTFIPNGHVTFDSWEAYTIEDDPVVQDFGGVDKNENPHTYTFIKKFPMCLIVNYQLEYKLTIKGFVGGTVNQSIAGSYFTENTTITLTATANSGFTFKGWSGDSTAKTSVLSLTLIKDTTVCPIFLNSLDPVAITFNIVGNGSITKTPDLSTYAIEANINLTATADSGYVFKYWTIQDSFQDKTYETSAITHQVYSVGTITATFQELLTITVINPNNGGTVSKVPDLADYLLNASVQLFAQADQYHNFDHWEIDSALISTSPTTLTMTAPKEVTVFFSEKEYNLTLSHTGSGTVTKSPNTTKHPYHSVVQLTATPDADYTFVQWSGSLTSTDAQANLTIAGESSVQALFILTTYELSVFVEGSGSVTQTPILVNYPKNSTVELKAVVGTTSVFGGWTGDVPGELVGNPNISLRMDSDRKVTAHFYVKTKSTVSNWKLLCSDDNVAWTIAHIAFDKYSWAANEVYSYSFGHYYLSSIIPVIRGFIAVKGHFIATLHVYGNIFCLVLTTVTLTLELKKITTEFEGYFGIFEVKGHFYKTLLPVVSSFNLVGYIIGSLNIAVQNTVSVAFLISAPIKGTMSIVNTEPTASKIRSNISAMFVTYVREGYVILNRVDNCRAIFVGVTSYVKGSLDLSSLQMHGFLQGSLSFVKLEFFVELTTFDFKGLALIGGDFTNTNILETYLDINGGIPLPISVVFENTLGDLRPQLRLVLSIYVTIDSNRFYIDAYFYGTSTTGYLNGYLRNTTSVINVFRGLKPSFYVYWETASISTDIKLRINTQGVLDSTVSRVTLLSAGMVPFVYYGSFISSIEDTISSLIFLRNNQYFFTEFCDLRLPEISTSIGILVEIVGTLSSSFSNLFCYMPAATPIAITANLTSQLWSPSGVAIGWIPLFGKSFIFLTNSTFSSYGTHSIGSLKKTLDSFTWSLTGRTILKIFVEIDLRPGKIPLFIAYGFFLRTLCKINILIPSTLFCEIRLNTPIVNNSKFYGSFNQKLKDFETNITLRLQLVHGVIESELLYSVDFMGWSLIGGTLTIPAKNLGIRSVFEDSSTFISGILDLDLVRNPSNSKTVATVIKISGFTKALITIKPVLQNIDFKITGEADIAFRGRINIYQYPAKYLSTKPTDAIPTPRAFIQAIVSEFVYGKLEVFTQHFNASNLSFFGQASRKVYGVLESVTNELYGFVEIFFPFYLKLDSTLRSVSWFCKATSVVVYFDITLADLNVLKNKIIGTNAGNIFGIFTSSTYDFYQPLRTNIRVRVEIYGIIVPNKNNISGYFRADAGIVGSIFGGDTKPCERGSPCYDRNLLANPLSDSENRLFWTLGYTTSLIYMYQAIPFRRGVLGGVLSSSGRYNYYLYTVEYDRTELLIFMGATQHGTSFTSEGFVPIKGFLDGNADASILWSFIGYKDCEIYGLISMKFVGTFDAVFRKGIVTYIELRNLSIAGRITSDLPLLVCEFFGFIAIGGSLESVLKTPTLTILGKIRIPIEGLFDNLLEPLESEILLSRAHQVYGRFSNYYLFWTYTTFIAKSKIVGFLNETLEQKSLSFHGLSSHFISTINVKLARIYVKILLEHYGDAVLFGTIKCDLQPVNFVLRISVPNLGKIPEIVLAKCDIRFSLLVPIRIYIDFRAKVLDTVFTNFQAVALIGGNFIKTLEHFTSSVELLYIKPVLGDLVLNLDSLLSDLLLFAYPTGHLNSITETIYIYDEGLVGRSYGDVLGSLEDCTMISDLWVSEKSVYLPCEKLYTVAGKLDSANRAMEYRLDLYDADSGERMQSITTLNIPYSYSFDKVDYGRFVVLATPVFGVYQTQAYSVLIDDEV